MIWLCVWKNFLLNFSKWFFFEKILKPYFIIIDKKKKDEKMAKVLLGNVNVNNVVKKYIYLKKVSVKLFFSNCKSKILWVTSSNFFNCSISANKVKKLCPKCWNARIIINKITKKILNEHWCLNIKINKYKIKKKVKIKEFP